MNIIGYGEDALTYWALTTKTTVFLNALGDKSPVEDAILFFRPSFGRRGSTKLTTGDTADSSQFGEFDSILATKHAVYLIEVKWSRSSEIEGASINLRPEQVRRHQVFRSYLETWKMIAPDSWQAYFTAQNGFIEAGGVRFPIAPPNSQLANSLEVVLARIHQLGIDEIKDVVLFVRTQGGRTVDAVRDPDFRLVVIDCLSPSGFIEL